ncbi:DUF1697 domain-containing protein [Aliifodinibius sp. S!AR15-10]|uniref:DUF1697 domain-containing protein n=1 Tax=Aliifodinibius sp. S!AR15-10 TaxID=2950437 RepID=UPI00285658D4|nr:DUF1697 domain-containing protein [Aliifodinibius sp. S!AR15-10]MDR8391401.1 DUF1697 domain-containing protein [Aliifodinibius sp. S!AR15-10]
MKTYIALFRGINVGGNNILPMKELRTLLKNLGFRQVNTYIQTGNVVFQSDNSDIGQLADSISGEVNKQFGFEPRVFVMTQDELQAAARANPFHGAESEPSRLYLTFLAEAPQNPDLEALEDIKRDSERFELKGKVLYLHAPEGVGRSKLAAKVERHLDVPMTSRNWRTVQKIMEMAEEAI